MYNKYKIDSTYLDGIQLVYACNVCGLYIISESLPEYPNWILVPIIGIQSCVILEI